MNFKKAAVGMFGVATVAWLGGVCFFVERTPAADLPHKAAVAAPFDGTVDRTVAKAGEAANAAQKTWSEHLGLPVVEKNSIGMELMLVPPGKFPMGAPDAERQPLELKNTRHTVTLTRAFYVGKTEVTIADFRKFIEDAEYRTDAEKDGEGGWGWTGEWEALAFEQRKEFSWRRTGFPQADDHPVVNVSWNDANAFCEWLSSKESKNYRLLTEAEWEYACRAGTTTKHHGGDDLEALARFGNVPDGTNRKKFGVPWGIMAEDGYVFTAPVARFRPNGFGLHDMHGNVSEWCNDWFDGDYYARSPTADPQGPPDGEARVIRGGGWLGLNVRGALSAVRSRRDPRICGAGTGFRVALIPAPKQASGSDSAR